MRWTLLASISVVALLLLNFFPHAGRPHFRYTGSDPSIRVVNLGWPLATAIYGSRSDLHVGPLARIGWPLQIVAFAAVGFATVRRTARTRSLAHQQK
jgi:hypothetical protein